MLIRRVSSFGIVVLCLAICAALISCKPVEKAAAPAKVASIAAPLGVAPDLDTRLAKFKAIAMPVNRGGLSLKEVQLVQKLVDAFHPDEFMLTGRYGSMPHDVSQKSLELFGREVVPAVHEMPTLEPITYTASV